MTKRTTKITTALSLALIVFAGLNCFAATPVQFNAAGSTAMFNLAALAADQTSGCGTNIWTKKSGASGIDSRRGDIPAQTANIWIVWNNAKTTVCSYLAVDSVIGKILFFAQPVATLSIPSSEIGASRRQSDSDPDRCSAGCDRFTTRSTTNHSTRRRQTFVRKMLCLPSTAPWRPTPTILTAPVLGTRVTGWWARRF